MKNGCINFIDHVKVTKFLHFSIYFDLALHIVIAYIDIRNLSAVIKHTNTSVIYQMILLVHIIKTTCVQVTKKKNSL